MACVILIYGKPNVARTNSRELERTLVALDWYIDDREECAKEERRCLHDPEAQESQTAARKASDLRDKLKVIIKIA